MQEFLSWHRSYLLCSNLLFQSLLLPNLYHLGCYRKNTYKKTYLSTSLLLGWKIFPTSFWWSLSVLLPYWEEIVPYLLNLAAIEDLIEDVLKLSYGGKLTIFTSHQVKQLLNGRGHLWMSEQRILRYQVELMENLGLTISLCVVVNPATLLCTPKGSFPFHSCLETLDHWAKPQEELSENSLTNPEEIWYTNGSSFLSDGKRRAGYAIVSSFETIEAKPLSPVYFSPIGWAHSPESSFKAWKRKKRSHLHWLQVCLSGATCTCCYLERKRPLDHPRVPDQMWWSNP